MDTFVYTIVTVYSYRISHPGLVLLAKYVVHRVRQEFNHIDYRLGNCISATVMLHHFSIWV